MAEEERKPIIRQWWFWLIIAIAIFIAIFAFGEKEDPVEPEVGMEDVNDAGNGTERDGEGATDEERQEEAENPEEPELIGTPSETTLQAGDYKVGTDIPPGRYVITGDGVGDLIIVTEKGSFEVNEVLDKSGEQGVMQVTADLKDGFNIHIARLQAVTFSPTETIMLNTLSAGTWVVGRDIAPGEYTVSTPEGKGKIIILDKTNSKTTNEILDALGEIGVKEFTVTLEEGQRILISEMEEVRFEEGTVP